MDLYRKIYFNSEEICHVTNVQKYQIQPTITFTQAETIDCNQYTQVNKIFYWQETDYNLDIDDIKLLITNTNYLNSKQNDIFVNFSNGKLINYENIGRISFAVIETESTDVFKIYDILNNDVTHTFDTYYETINNCRLFVSKNIYSHGEINFKIKKI